MFNIFTDLDTLLDSRHTILSILSPAICDKVIEDKSYFNRKCDNFYIISNDIFRQLYDRRGKYILLNSVRTSMVEYINYIIADILTDIKFNNDKITIYINIHPYNLIYEETEEIKLLFKKLFPVCDIVIVSLKMSEIDPKFINSKDIGYMFMYDGILWLEDSISRGGISSSPLLDTVLITPPYTYNGDMKINNIISKTLISLETLPMELFCGDIKLK